MAKKALAVAPPIEDAPASAVATPKRKRSKVEAIKESVKAEESEEEVPEPSPALEQIIRRATPEEQRMYATPPVALLSMEEACNILAESKFMIPQFKKWIAERFRLGEFFDFEREGTPMAEYRMASKQDVIDLAAEGVRQTTLKRAVAINTARRSGAGATVTHEDGTTTTRQPRAARTKAPGATPGRSRKGTVEFVFTLPTGKALENRLANMPKQGRILMEIASEAGQTRMNGEALDAVLQAGAPAKGVIPKIVPLVLQRFKAFIRDGVYEGLVTKEESK